MKHDCTSLEEGWVWWHMPVIQAMYEAEVEMGGL
jgi:hypothetical protein